MRMRAWMWAGLIVFAGVNCVQVLDGDHPYQPGDTSVQGKACTADSNCDDGNPCTTDTCSKEIRICEYLTQTDGFAPDLSQKPEDCHRIRCVSGKPTDEDDPQDVKNDNNSCTDDVCEAGVPKNNVLMDGVACTQGTANGKCKTGICTISCTQDNDCNDSNPCTNDQCNISESTCVYESLDGVATPGAMQTTGDCKVRFCDNGVDKDVNDNADVNVDGNSCTDDVCTDGVPNNPPVAARTLCSPAPNDDVCDGIGKCVDCVDAADCVTITETECEKRSCVNNKCEIAYQGNDTLASPVLQTAGDCLKVVCNGTMGTTSVPDDADLPNDNKACTKDTCSMGKPVYTSNPQGTTCGTNQVCNTMGDCVGCNAPTDCQGTDSFCQTRTCVNNVCGVNNTPNGTDLPTSDQMPGDCKVRECNGTGGIKTSVLTTDVPVDGNPCTQDVCSVGGIPSNPAATTGTACNVNGGDACDGSGNCEKSNGKPCVANAECVSSMCVDGVCCNAACATICQSCNVAGNLGTCTTVPKGQQDIGCNLPTEACNTVGDCDDINGQPCSGPTACLSNFCVDSVCCESACNTACKSCNAPGGMPGVCGNLPAMSTDIVPTNLCVNPSQCDGNGVCKKTNGANCGGNNECFSNFCVDAVCCDSMCTTDCKSCNVAGMVGTCSNMAMGLDDGACSGPTKSCDGMGTCKLEQGSMCVVGAECFSTICKDGFCCNNGCTGLCESCAASESDGPNGTCSPVTAGTDPSNECSAEPASTCGNSGFCDGATACQKYANGTVCAASSCSGSTQTNADTCNGIGTCVDNGTTDCSPYVCSGSSCAVTCAVDTDCTTGNYCTASNSCAPKKALGQVCTGANECTNNICVDGVCCNSSCGIICQGCNVPGNAGTCVNLPLNTDDTACSGVYTCNGGSGMAACKLKLNQMCSLSSQCASGKCTGGICVP